MSFEQAKECYTRIINYLLENDDFCHFIFSEERTNMEFDDWKDNHREIVMFLRRKNVFIRSGMTKIVLVYESCDFVCKIPLISFNKKDYCTIEYENYKKALNEDIGCFFARCEFMCEFKDPCGVINLPTYLMEYVEADEGETEEEMALTTGRNIEDISGDEEETLDFLEGFYDYKDFCKLIEFLDDNTINDVHSGNIGRNHAGNWVIIDYSGY